MIVRPAEPRDVPAIAAIWNAVIRDSLAIFASEERSEAAVAELVARDAFVAAEGDRLLGFARFFPFRAGSGYARTAEWTVLVAPGGQGRGAGRALFAAVADAARAAGMHTLWGVVSAPNAAGCDFHRAMGFTEQGRLGEVGRKFGRWHDAVFYGYRL